MKGSLPVPLPWDRSPTSELRAPGRFMRPITFRMVTTFDAACISRADQEERAGFDLSAS
jgi:hypothetical protein